MRAALSPLWSLGLVLASLFGDGKQAQALEVRKWACCYCAQAVPAMAAYDLLVVDPRIQGLEDLAPLPGKKRKVLAYLSLGEVHPGASLYPQVQGTPLLLEENPVWGSWKVDARDLRWQSLLLQEARAIRDMGFDGLFLDTLDTALDLERRNPRQHEGMGEAVTSLVKQLRKALPRDFMLCQNRGLEVAPKTARWLDALCLESGFTTYDAASKQYHPVEPVLQEKLLQAVDAAREVNPELLLLSLDYAPGPESPLAITAVQKARRHGLVPSVNTYALDSVFPPPED